MTGTLGVDYVVCAICDFPCKSLAKHITGVHGITKDAYIAEHGGPIKCTSTTENYSYKRDNWITKAKADGVDLTEYKEKMGQAVSQAILSNPIERVRRAAMMACNNRTQVARLRSSRIAKRTSARQDIQQRRAGNLRRWREENPDLFNEITQKFARSSCASSKPELALFDLVCRMFPNIEWLSASLFMPSGVDNIALLKTTNASGRTQVDILSRTHKIAIEFDGIHHFKQIRTQEFLDRVRIKDAVKNAVIVNEGFTLIRISHEQWLQRGRFTGDCIGKLYDIISDALPGLHFIGEQHAGKLTDLSSSKSDITDRVLMHDHNEN